MAAYVLVDIDVHDPVRYEDYKALAAPTVAQYGGRYLVRGGQCVVTEGKQRARTVVMEFPSYDAALACYRSPDYQAAKALRQGKGEVDLIVIDGYAGGG